MTDEAAQLAALMGELRPQSLAALQHALAVAEIDGIEGTLVIKIPRRRGDQTDVSFLTGKARLSLE